MNEDESNQKFEDHDTCRELGYDKVPWSMGAHAGSVNILFHAKRLGRFRKIHGLTGGTHLVGRSENYLRQTIEGFKQFGLSLISPCHCTGFKATARLWQAFPKAFVLNFSGRVINANKEPKRRLF